MKSGAKQVDRLLKISVLIREDQEVELKSLVKDFCKRLNQECIWLEKSMSLLEFIESDPPERSENE